MKRLETLAQAVAILALQASCGEDPPPPARHAAPVVEAFRGPDGMDGWYAVHCERLANCYQRAAGACPTGYSIEDKAERRSVSSEATARRTPWRSVEAEGAASETISRTLIIRCKAAAAAADPAPAQAQQ